MNKYLEYFISLNVLTKEKKHTSTLNRTRSYADLPNSDRNSPRGRNATCNWKVIFSNKGEIPGPYFGCFSLLYSLVISALCPPRPPHSPKVFKWKSFLSKVSAQRRHSVAEKISSKSILVCYDPSPELSWMCWERTLAPYPVQFRSFGWMLSLHILGHVPERT